MAQVIEGREAVTEGGDDVNFTLFVVYLCTVRDYDYGCVWSMCK